MITDAKLLIIEPFYGGSHRQLIDLLSSKLVANDERLIYTMPAKKWPWRCRCSALYFARVVPKDHNFRILFASSVLNMAELIALRPDLSTVRKVVYFHENQLVYPVQWWKERDFQFGYNQIITCLVADEVVFNSSYNCQSFLAAIGGFLRMMPDHRPKGIADEIRPKCRVLYFPVDFTSLLFNGETSSGIVDDENAKPLHIVWPHRWEHDKNPDSFFEVLFKLAEEDNVPFTLSVLGQMYDDVPAVFEDAKKRLSGRISHWGFCVQKETYADVLQNADVVVSTAKHEFFGVAMLEAVFLGCYPLCPNRLVYPEIFPGECLYNTRTQLRKRLRDFCRRPQSARFRQSTDFDLSRFSWQTLKADYRNLLQLDSVDD